MKQKNTNGGDTYFDQSRFSVYTVLVTSYSSSFIVDSVYVTGKEVTVWLRDGTIVGFKESKPRISVKMKSSKESSDSCSKKKSK